MNCLCCNKVFSKRDEDYCVKCNLRTRAYLNGKPYLWQKEFPKLDNLSVFWQANAWNGTWEIYECHIYSHSNSHTGNIVVALPNHTPFQITEQQVRICMAFQ